MTTVADAVGRTLAATGVRVVFGVAGSGNLIVSNALVAGGARYVAARHESGAVGMADGWARVTREVGVASVHQGPGLTNTLTALAEAAKSRTPLLVLSGETPAGARGSNFRIDQHDLVESVGAVAERVHARGSAVADAQRALQRARREHRPVVLMLPIDLQALPEAPGGDATPRPAAAAAAAQAAPPTAGAEALDAAAAALAQAARPLILAGRGALGAEAELAALAQRCGALLATTAVTKGMFSADPFCLGISGGLATPLATELIAQADTVLAVGASLNPWTTRHGTLIGPGATVIAVDIEAAAFGRHRPVDVPVLGDAPQVAAALCQRLDPAPGWRSSQLRERIGSGGWGEEPDADAGLGQVIDPRTFSRELNRRLPADRTVAVDSGHFTGWPAFYLDVAAARDWCFVNAYQAVGLALGVAIGAAVARPERVTVAALGDGGLFLSLAELETAARLGLRLVIAVYDDEGYGAEVHHFGALGQPTEIAQFPPADLAAIAAAAGLRAATVRTAADLDVLDSWLRDGTGPLLLDAKVDPQVRAAWLQDAFATG